MSTSRETPCISHNPLDVSINFDPSGGRNTYFEEIRPDKTKMF